jgi:hypothetical protein
MNTAPRRDPVSQPRLDARAGETMKVKNRPAFGVAVKGITQPPPIIEPQRPVVFHFCFIGATWQG